MLIHVHSYYSKLEGVLSPETIAEFATSQGSSFAALTDFNDMSGLIQFAQICKQKNIKPVFGVQIDDPENQELNAIFLAKNNKGYSALCRLITSRNLDEEFSLINYLNKPLESLFVISASEELIRNLPNKKHIKDNFYVELIVTKKHKTKTRKLYELAKELNLKYVASNPAYFEKPEDHKLHKVVSAIRENTTLSNLAEEKSVDPEFYLKPVKEFKNIWRNLPEAIKNIEFIADNCNVDLQIGKTKQPEFHLPAGETPFSYLYKICFNGLSQKYQPITEKVTKRLQYELEVIDELGFCDYFLIVWDIVREAHKREMMTIGRGSAANSLVAYCLGITQVDPIKHNFYFERFLNRARTSPPDIDLDFSWRERDELVKYVFDKYGYDKVAMISTTVTFRARSAFREVAKVFGVADAEISKYGKKIPWTSAKNLPMLAEKFPETKGMKFDAEPWKSIVDIASKLAGFPRHSSIHPSGIVIAPGAMTDYVALEYAKNKGLGLIITQPDMYPIEDLGLIKIDLLSQRSLGVLRDTMTILEKEKAVEEVQKHAKIFKLF